MKFTRGEKIIIVILCVVAEIILAFAIVWMITSTHEIAVDHVAYADIYGASAPEAEDAEFVTDIYVGNIEIYRDGDGEPPEWYRPDEPMAAEWSASCKQVTEANNEAVFGDIDLDTDPCQQVKLLDVPLDADFQAYLYGLCREYDIPYTLAVAVIEAESTYRADVISKSSDYGLMQINKVCHEWLSETLGITDFLDPRQNALAGVYILSNYYREYKYPSGTLVAYNMGQSAAEALFAQGIYDTDYSRRVMDIKSRLEREGG